MVDIRCPKCGKQTTLRYSKTSGVSYYVCIKHPKCSGRVPAEEELGGVQGGRSPALEPAPDVDLDLVKNSPAEEDWSGGWGELSREDEAAAGKSRREKLKFDARVKHAESEDQKPGVEDWTEGWGESSRKPEPVKVRPRRRKEPPPAETGVITPVRKAGRAKRKSYGVVKRPESLGRVSVDKSGGQEREKPISATAAGRTGRQLATSEAAPSRGKGSAVSKAQRAPKAVAYKPLYKRGPAPAPELPQETEKPSRAPYKSLYKRAQSWEMAAQEQGQAESQAREEAKATHAKPQYRRRPKPAPVLPQETEKPKPAPYKPQYKRLKSWEQSSWAEEASESQANAPFKPQYRRNLKSAPVTPQEQAGPPPPPYKPLFPRAEKRMLASSSQEHPRPRPRKAPRAKRGGTGLGGVSRDVQG